MGEEGRLGRVATINIHHGARAGRHLASRGFADVVSQRGLDIVSVQEADRRIVRSWFVDQPQALAAASGLHVLFVPTRRVLLTGTYGHALLTRAPLRAIEIVSLPDAGQEPRRAVIGRTLLGEADVTVASVHLHNSVPVATLQLDVLLDRLLKRPGPHLLMGDLNAQPRHIGERLLAAGFGEHGAPATFPSDAPKKKIDWIVGNGIRIVDQVAEPTERSDHRPLFASVATLTTRAPVASSE